MAFLAGQKIRASYFNAVVVWNYDSATTNGTTASAYPTFTNTLAVLGIMGVAFVAPPSGKVNITWSCRQVRSNSAGASVLVDCEVKTGSTVGSGVLVRASNDPTASSGESHAANNNHQPSGFAPLSGLISGASYNAVLTYTVTGGTATINGRQIEVTPLLA